MKLNWGIGAFTLFGGFVIFIILMVFLAFNQKHELVTEEYYEKELEFKDVLRKKENLKSLNGDLTYSLNENLTIKFPISDGSPISGKIYFFKPSNMNDDKVKELFTNDSIYIIDISRFSSGMYRMKIDWANNGNEYFNEFKIDIP